MREPAIFSILPSLKTLMINWIRDHPEEVNVANLHSAMHDTLLKEAYKDYEKETKEDPSCFVYTIEDLLEFSGLKTLCESTVHRWMKIIGCGYKAAKKNYYTDRHEDPDNISYRELFIAAYFKMELHCYRWIQIPEEHIPYWKKKFKCVGRHFPWDAGRRFEMENTDGEKKVKINVYYEYHVDVVFDEHMLEVYLYGEGKEWGGNLSVMRPKNRKPLMIHGHDEVCLNQHCTCNRCWHYRDMGTLKPKSNGASLMASGFLSRECGLGMNHGSYFTNEIREEVNEIRKKEKYECEEAALIVNGSVNKPPLADNLFLRFFDPGANRDGYWNSKHFILQCEDVIDCLDVIFP